MGAEKPKISVIIPVYNVVEYVEKSINSVLNQSYSNLEIILVDDGSTDGSGAICDESAKRDKRIKVIHQNNSGLSDARNRGLDCTTGDFISFVDGDDTIAEDMFDVLFSCLVKYEADLSICRYCNVWSEHQLEFVGNDHKVRIYNGEENLREFLYGKIFDSAVWAKLYKSSIIGDIRFRSGIIGEDIPFNFDLLKQNIKVVICGESKYFYLQQRPGSICNSGVINTTMEFRWRWEEVREACRNYFPSLEIFVVRRQVMFCIGLYNRLYSSKEHQREKDSLRCLVRVHLNEIQQSNICEKKLKIAAFLLVSMPYIYVIIMRIYKIVIARKRV